MFWVRIVLASAVLGSAVAKSAAAQDSLVIATDARIRVTVADGSGFQTVGRYAGMRGDTLLVAVPGLNLPVQYLLRGVRGVEVSQGSHRQVGSGAKLGAKIGAVMGVATSVALLASTNGCRNASILGQVDDETRALCWVGAVFFPLGGVLNGAMYGALIGAFIVKENWLPVRLEGLHVGMVSTGRGTLGLGVGVAF